MSSTRVPNHNLLTTLREWAVDREYCIWASPYLIYLRQPLGVLILLGCSSLLCGLFVAPQGFVILAAVVAVVIVGCAWPWIGILGVSCQLRFASTRTEEGRPVDAELVITNRWPWPVWGLAVEGGFASDGEGIEEPAVAVARIGGWSRGYFHWTFTPTLRGRYPMTNPQLVTGFPFGLWKAKKGIEVLSKLIVWPERFALPPFALSSGTQSWIGQESECATGNTGHRTSVREYRVGDSMRQVHWAKTALYDKLVSYEREGQAVTEAMISVDTHPSLHHGKGSQSSVEWTVRIAASICDTLLRQGVNVSIDSHAEQFRSLCKGNSPSVMFDWFALLGTAEATTSRTSTRAASKSRTASLSIHITTDRAPRVTSDSIVFVLNRSVDSGATSRQASQCWIELSQETDIPTQVRQGWQQGRRGQRYAV